MQRFKIWHDDLSWPDHNMHGTPIRKGQAPAQNVYLRNIYMPALWQSCTIFVRLIANNQTPPTSI